MMKPTNGTPAVSRIIVSLALLVAGGAAWAQETGDDDASAPRDGSATVESVATETPPPEVAPDLLDVSLTLYAWLPNLTGTTGVAGLTFDIDESFFDLLGKSDHVFGLMGSLDLEYKRLVFEFNGAVTLAEFSGQKTLGRTGPGGGGPEVEVGAEIEIDAAWYEVLGGYRIHEGPLLGRDDPDSRVMIDAFLGGRFTSMSVKADVTATQMVTLPNGVVLEAGEQGSFDQNEGWAELFVGGRVGLTLGKHWRFILRGDVGGFGFGDSEFSWQGVAALAYGWQLEGWRLDLFGGYRALGQDYKRGGFTWDVVTHGPILGARCSFAF